MKARRIGGLAAACVLLLLTLAVAAALLRTERTAAEERRVFEQMMAEPTEEPQTTAEASGGYLLCSLSDGLGLFRAGEAAPFARVEAELSCLPACDRTALASGIPAATEAELWQLVEDFAS